jgi:hypothetical protein
MGKTSVIPVPLFFAKCSFPGKQADLSLTSVEVLKNICEQENQ